MTNQNQIPKIEPMPLSELQEAVIAAQDDMASWKQLRSDSFRLVRINGQILCVMPTSQIAVDEIRLFKNPTVSAQAVICNALEGDNLNMFFMAAIRAQQHQVKLIKR